MISNFIIQQPPFHLCPWFRHPYKQLKCCSIHFTYGTLVHQHIIVCVILLQNINNNNTKNNNNNNHHNNNDINNHNNNDIDLSSRTPSLLVVGALPTQPRGTYASAQRHIPCLVSCEEASSGFPFRDVPFRVEGFGAFEGFRV